MPMSLLAIIMPISLLAAELDCHDAGVIEDSLNFARQEFKHQGQAAVMAPLHVIERPTDSGTFVARDPRTEDEVAEVVGRMSGDVFFVHKMAVLPPLNRSRTREISPGAPYRILEYLRRNKIVKNLRIHVNTEVFEALQQQKVPLPEQFIAHWAGFDLTEIKNVPLYNIDDPGYQTWLVFKATPPVNPNDKLRPGYSPRPSHPTIR